MNVLYALIIILIIISIVATLLIAGKGDENYNKSTKRNTTNLTMIYVVIISISFIALGFYIKLFT